MAYQRKTKDVWYLYANYGQGWEHETTEETFREAREQVKCYRENCPQYAFRIAMKREAI